MREFFHGWRRKAGVATLVMALVVTGLWIRSRATRDWLKTPLRRDIVDVISFNGRIHWWASVPNRKFDGRTTFKSDNIVSALDLDDHRKMMIIWREWFERNEGREWDIPYWSIVLPLTLSSAYLILWEPRTKPKDQPNA